MLKEKCLYIFHASVNQTTQTQNCPFTGISNVVSTEQLNMMSSLLNVIALHDSFIHVDMSIAGMLQSESGLHH